MSVPYMQSVCLSTLVLMLSACSTTSTIPKDRDQYLNQFIGQPTEVIRKNLDLTQVGYRDVSDVIVRNHQLIYLVKRPMTIPIPTAVGPGAVPIMLDSSTSYDVNLQCQIVFHIQNNIAKSVSYTGKTC
jgi:hypothetical protein